MSHNIYSNWDDGMDFRIENPEYCDKCNKKGTFLTQVINDKTGVKNVVASDCECKKELIIQAKLKVAGIHPRYINLDLDKEIPKKAIKFFDTFYKKYRNKNEISQNFAMIDTDIHKKTKQVSLFARFLFMQDPSLNIRYITMPDLIYKINMVWKEGDDEEIKRLMNADFLIVDKIELGISYIRQNMNLLTFNNIFDKRDYNQKPTIISCSSMLEMEILGLDPNAFIIKDNTKVVK